jgi:Flp pilus assembly pilin Flp
MPLLPFPDLLSPRDQRGQATTEYALVLLGAAAVALLLVAWATRTGAFTSLFDAVLDSIKQKV